MNSNGPFFLFSFIEAKCKFAARLFSTGPLQILAIATFVVVFVFFFLDNLAARQVYAAADLNMVKLLNNGQDSDRFVILVAGEGYTETERQLYYKDIDRLITNGLLGHDVFAANKKAFNVYVAETWSKQSGPSVAQKRRDTAFDISFADNSWGGYFGKWYQNKKTTDLLDKCMNSCPHTPRVVILLVNTYGDGHGAETLADYVLLACSGEDWKTMQHEFAHAIAGLFDEYIASGPNQAEYKGVPICDKNAATTADRFKVPWSAFIDPSTPVPTPFYVHPKNGIGVYPGGATYAKGTYRPSLSCRMNNLNQDFCAYCKSIISAIINSRNPAHKPELALPATSSSPIDIANKASKTFDFKITKDPTLHNEPNALPLSKITIGRYENLLLNIFNNKATNETKAASSKSVILRSAAPISKAPQKELVRLVTLSGK